MAKKFDYNQAKLNMAKESASRESIIRDNPKTREELAKAELERERAEKQAEVDDVLYEDVTERSKKPAHVIPPQEPSDESLSDAELSDINGDLDEEIEPIEEEDEEEIEVYQPVKKATSVQSASPSSNEALVSDFVKNLDSDETEEYADDTEVFEHQALQNEVVKAAPEPPTKEVPKVPPKEEKPTRADVVKQQSARRASKPRGVTYDDIKCSVVRNFPTELINTLKMLFPSAKNQTDILVAFVYLSLGKPNDIDIPDSARELIADYRGEDVSNRDVQDNLSSAISQLKVTDRQILQKLSAIELMSSYVLFDRLGFRKKDQKSPDSVDFLENGMADLINQLEKQSDLKVMRDTQKKGTPIK